MSAVSENFSIPMVTLENQSTSLSQTEAPFRPDKNLDLQLAKKKESIGQSELFTQNVFTEKDQDTEIFEENTRKKMLNVLIAGLRARETREKRYIQYPIYYK